MAEITLRVLSLMNRDPGGQIRVSVPDNFTVVDLIRYLKRLRVTGDDGFEKDFLALETAEMAIVLEFSSYSSDAPYEMTLAALGVSSGDECNVSESYDGSRAAYS